MERYLNLFVVHFTDRFYGNIIAMVLHIFALWIKCIRRIYKLSCNAHRWLLGTLINQDHIRFQLITREVIELFADSQNIIVNQCTKNRL